MTQRTLEDQVPASLLPGLFKQGYNAELDVDAAQGWKESKAPPTFLRNFSDSSSCKLHPEDTDKNRTRKGLQLHARADQAWQTWSASLMKVSDWAHAFRPRRPCTSTPASRCQPVLLLPLAGASCGLMRAIIRRPVFKFANLFREKNCMNMAWPFSGVETTVCSHSRSRAILVQHSRRSALHG